MPRTLSTLALLVLSTTTLAFPPADAPRPPREAAAAMTVPDGFKVTLFAGEPDVTQPIAMCFDDRGRLWVAECHSYPKWIKDGSPGNDRILIFEDTDNDGVFDKRTVFLDKLANLTSIEFGFGGIYALTSPNLIHIPLDPKTDRPSGAPKILLDGWSLDAGHNMVNGLKWGPDGWLYGCHGITATSRAGVPGSPKDKRPPINCGVWRFHPVTHKYEVVAHGGTNPWGIDWDEQGELYFTNCVIDHAFHVIPGGHYQRMYGSDFNPHLYKLMGSCVDHLHWAGGPWTSSRTDGGAGGAGKHSEAGGGHAHSGCMIYLGDNFPKEYRNNLFTGNIHGNRLNRDRIDYTNKGPVLRHEKDFLFGNDSWFRPIAMDYGPDGGVYVIDWTDTGECHNYQEAHKTSGRIYKVTYGSPNQKNIDLNLKSSTDLIGMHLKTNEWQVRHSRRLLQERFRRGGNEAEEIQSAVRDFKYNSMIAKAPKLPSVFAHRRVLQTVMALDADWGGRFALVHHQDQFDYFVQGYFDANSDFRQRFSGMIDDIARNTKERDARLRIASGLQRISMDERWSLLPSLSRIESGDDLEFSLMFWYAVEGLPELDLHKSIQLLRDTKTPLVREFLSRRIASLSDTKKASEGIEVLVHLAAVKSDLEIARDILAGLQGALQGQRNPRKPETWDDDALLFRHTPIKEVYDRGLALGVLFGDKIAIERIHKLIKDPKAELPRRQDALKTLVFKQPDDLSALLVELLDDDALRSPAIRALATIKDDAIAPRLIGMVPKLSAAERGDAIATLASRPAFALALLDAVAAKKIERKELGPIEVRQLLALKDPKVTARVEEVWGTIRPTAKDKSALMSKYKKLLAADELKTADHAQGRLLFTKHCATCHKLFGEGAAIGPDITGSQRANLDYLLENILDPSAVVPREYQVTIVTTASGRTLTGIVKDDNDRALTLQTANELVIVPKGEIEQRTASKQSMMPEGVLEQMTIGEARALVAYLQRATPLGK